MKTRLSREGEYWVGGGREGGGSLSTKPSFSLRAAAGPPLLARPSVAKPNRGSRGRAGPQVRCRRLLPVDSPFHPVLESEANF